MRVHRAEPNIAFCRRGPKPRAGLEPITVPSPRQGNRALRLLGYSLVRAQQHLSGQHRQRRGLAQNTKRTRNSGVVRPCLGALLRANDAYCFAGNVPVDSKVDSPDCRTRSLLMRAVGLAGRAEQGIHLIGRILLHGRSYVHGAGDVGWYWHLVEKELRRRGHVAVAPDLPCEDDSAGLREYADTVVNAIANPDELVVVAQSFGGFTAPLVAERLPVNTLVLVTAMIPHRGRRPRIGSPIPDGTRPCESKASETEERPGARTRSSSGTMTCPALLPKWR